MYIYTDTNATTVTNNNTIQIVITGTPVTFITTVILVTNVTTVTAVTNVTIATTVTHVTTIIAKTTFNYVTQMPLFVKFAQQSICTKSVRIGLIYGSRKITKIK